MIFFHSQRWQPVIYYLSLLFSGVGRSPHSKFEVGEWNTLFEEWEIAARSKEIDGQGWGWATQSGLPPIKMRRQKNCVEKEE